MKVTNLSFHPHRPCMIVRWPNVSVLLDCAIDFTSFNNFLPYLYTQTTRFRHLPIYQDDLPYLRIIRDNVYVECLPEVHPTPLEHIAMDSIDCILVSNWQSLIALPFFCENSLFKGSIYATEPVLQFGRLMMEEMLEYFDRIVLDDQKPHWKNFEIYSTFNNIPKRNPLEWKKFYTKERMESALSKVTPLTFKQSVRIDDNLLVTATSSGYSIGSCNWVLDDGQHKLGYLSTSSSRAAHTKSVDWDKLRGVDAMILTSLSTTPDVSPEMSVGGLCQIVFDTLKAGGNVLIPVSPVGLIYDLIDIISKNIDVMGGISLSTPLYFISPVAKSALAYSNVNAEYLSEAKQNSVYTPEEPFNHANLLRSGRLKVYDSIFGAFSKDYKTPCVVFAGHPSLRIGDVPHLLEMWGGDPRNALIMTDPDYPLEEVYGPYVDLPIRAFYYPIDTRLNFSQLNPAILPDLMPKALYAPEGYSKPMIKDREEFVVQYPNFTPMKYNETLNVISRTAVKRKVKVHPELLKKLDVRGNAIDSSVGSSCIIGTLNAYDNVYEIAPMKKKTLSMKYTGKLAVPLILKALEKRGLFGRFEEPEKNREQVHIDSLDACITVWGDGLHTNIRSSKEHRSMLTNIVTSCLKSISSV